MADNTNYYPPVGFYFGVSIDGFSDTIDAEFQSVSGFSVDIETEEYAEGGENRFKHKLPVRTKYPNLVLKRGLVVKKSSLLDWCKNATENFQFEKRKITISLFTNASNQSGSSDLSMKTGTANGDSKSPNKALMVWTLVDCFPVKWSVDDFNATESKIVLETLELAFNYFTVKNNM